MTAWLVVLAILSALLSYFDQATLFMFVKLYFSDLCRLSALVLLLAWGQHRSRVRMTERPRQLPERRKLAHDSWRDTVSYLVGVNFGRDCYYRHDCLSCRVTFGFGILCRFGFCVGGREGL